MLLCVCARVCARASTPPFAPTSSFAVLPAASGLHPLPRPHAPCCRGQEVIS